MPSEEYMRRVLGENAETIAAAQSARMESLTDEEEPGEVEPEEEQVEEEEPEEEEEEGEEEPGELAPGEPEQPDEQEEPEEGDSEEQPEAHEDSFYVGRYRTREEAERAYAEKDSYIQRLQNERDEARQTAAYWQGSASTRSAPDGDFGEWAEAAIEENAEAGMMAAIQASVEDNDESYAYAYLEHWKETDPYEAAVWRNRLDTAIHLRQQQAPPPPTARVQETQAVIDHVWGALSEANPRLRADEQHIVQVLKSDPRLGALARSGDPTQVEAAVLAAHDRYRLESARPGTGTPRRARSGDVERVRAEKLAATVSTGDAASERRSSTPEFPAETAGMMEYFAKRGQRRDLQQ